MIEENDKILKETVVALSLMKCLSRLGAKFPSACWIPKIEIEKETANTVAIIAADVATKRR
jgi:hypothetical protein